MKTGIIIVAGGNGSRMDSDVPKQFLPLAGKPILMRTAERFREALPKCELVIVLPESQIDYWNQLQNEYRFTISHRIVQGGPTRFHSVLNALPAVERCQYIGIHDGVRPLAGNELIRGVLADARRTGAAIPAIPLADSLRVIETENSSPNENSSRIVDRAFYRAVQTPQFFRSDWLLDAYQVEYREAFTDDASVVEAAGRPIFLSEGDPRNLKLTTRFDLHLAELILATGE